MITDGHEILKRAWLYVRQNRFLWPLAFVIAFAGGGAQGFSLWIESPLPRGMTSYSPVQRIGEKLNELVRGNIPLLIFFITLGILVGLAVLALSVLAQASAMEGVAEVDSGRTIGLRDAVRMGKEGFLRLLALMVIYLVVLAVLSLPSFLFWWSVGKTKSMFLPCIGGLVLGLGFIVAAVVATIFMELAGRYAVLEGAGIIDSLHSAYALFREYYREVLVAWLYVLIITFCGVLAMALVLAIMSAPLSALFTVAYRHHNWFLISTSIVVFLISWGVAAAVTGAFAIMSSAVWTLTFLELEPGAVAVGVTPRGGSS